MICPLEPGGQLLYILLGRRFVEETESAVFILLVWRLI